MNVYIYTLSHPITKEVRYVGKTKNPKQRLRAHTNPARYRPTHKFNWIKKLKKSNLKPELKIIEEVPEEEWKFWEKYWIEQFKQWGFNLVNATSGGDGLNSGNSTSFKKGVIPWNKGTGNKGVCPVCSKVFNITKCDIKRGRKACSIKCGKTLWVKNVSKPVYQYSKDKSVFIKEWESTRKASTELGISITAIGFCCRKETKSSGGYFWTYEKLK